MNKRIESIQTQVDHFNQTIVKMDASIARISGVDKDILTKQRNALSGYVGVLQSIVDEYSNDSSSVTA